MKELYKLFGKAEKEVDGMFSIANVFNEMGKSKEHEEEGLVDERKTKGCK